MLRTHQYDGRRDNNISFHHMTVNDTFFMHEFQSFELKWEWEEEKKRKFQ